MRALQRVHEAAPSYYLTVSGQPPGGHAEARAHAFWHKLGYRETGEVKPAPPGLIAAMRGMEKPLRRDAVR
jgi:hypothetical protein